LLPPAVAGERSAVGQQPALRRPGGLPEARREGVAPRCVDKGERVGMLPVNMA